MKKSFTLFGLLFFTVACTFPLSAKSVEEPLVKNVEKSYKANKTLRADFTQTVYLKQYKRTSISKGTVLLKKPGMMRWEYNEPEKQIIVSDGVTLWFYFPFDDQVIKQQLKGAVSADSPYHFLLGQANLNKMFQIEPAKPNWKRDGYRYLSLTPKKPVPNLVRIVIGINKNHQVEETEITDHFGNATRVTLTNIKRNETIADNIFKFIPPEGVEVIQGRDY